MRRLRKALDVLLPVTGIVLVYSAVLLVVGIYRQLALVTIGTLLIEAGIWKLANPLLPSERRFNALREEVDALFPVVRRLNTAAVALRAGDESAREVFDSAREELHQSVERMAEVAGVEGRQAPVRPEALPR